MAGTAIGVRTTKSGSDASTELAQNLKVLFDRLGVTRRRYAQRHMWHHTSVSRFLSGERVPPWAFVEQLMTDVDAEAGLDGDGGVTDEVRNLLHKLHERAGNLSRSPARRARNLEDQLTQADSLATQLRLQVRRANRDLADATRRQQELSRRMRALLDQRRWLQADNARLWEGWQRRYDTLAREDSQLRGQITRLDVEVDRIKGVADAAEERCAALEQQLVQAEQGNGATLVTLLDSADTAELASLADTVSALDPVTRGGIAAELVKSFAIRRPITDAGHLLRLLADRGHEEHVLTTLPFIARIKPPHEIAALAESLHLAGMRHYTHILLNAAAAAQSCEDLAASTAAFVRAGIPETAQILLHAVIATRDRMEVVVVTSLLRREGMGGIVTEAMAGAQLRLFPRNLARLSATLLGAGLTGPADALLDSAALTRSAGHIADLADELSALAQHERAQTLLWKAVHHRPVHFVADLTHSLRPHPRVDADNALRDALTVRAVSDVAELVVYFDAADQIQHTALALLTVARRRRDRDLHDLTTALRDLVGDAYARHIWGKMARNSSITEAAAALAGLARASWPTAATALRDAVVHRPPGETVLLLGMLRAVSSALVHTALREAAQRLPSPERDRLAQQLAAADLDDFARAVDGNA